MACLPSQRTCYCGAVSKIRPLVYCGYSFVHIICCLFCSFIFCLLVLCYIAHHWIFLRRTVNKSHLSFTSMGQAIILFCFPDLKRPAVDLQVSTASHTLKKLCYIAPKVVICLLIIREPLMVLYSTKSWCFSGSSAVLRRLFA